MSQQPIDSTRPAPPCGPRELKRLRFAGGIIIVVCVFVLVMAITFGNQPRAFVDRMNLLLAPLVLGSLILCGHTLWQFHRACTAETERPGR
jgi:4-amino-4-deoxy-L-arabinose transferase-like glycosyltransferase